MSGRFDSGGGGSADDTSAGTVEEDTVETDNQNQQTLEPDDPVFEGGTSGGTGDTTDSAGVGGGDSTADTTTDTSNGDTTDVQSGPQVESPSGETESLNGGGQGGPGFETEQTTDTNRAPGADPTPVQPEEQDTQTLSRPGAGEDDTKRAPGDPGNQTIIGGSADSTNDEREASPSITSISGEERREFASSGTGTEGAGETDTDGTVLSAAVGASPLGVLVSGSAEEGREVPTTAYATDLRLGDFISDPGGSLDALQRGAPLTERGFTEEEAQEQVRTTSRAAVTAVTDPAMEFIEGTAATRFAGPGGAVGRRPTGGPVAVPGPFGGVGAVSRARQIPAIVRSSATLSSSGTRTAATGSSVARAVGRQGQFVAEGVEGLIRAGAAATGIEGATQAVEQPEIEVPETREEFSNQEVEAPERREEFSDAEIQAPERREEFVNQEIEAPERREEFSNEELEAPSEPEQEADPRVIQADRFAGQQPILEEEEEQDPTIGGEDIEDPDDRTGELARQQYEQTIFEIEEEYGEEVERSRIYDRVEEVPGEIDDIGEGIAGEGDPQTATGEGSFAENMNQAIQEQTISPETFQRPFYVGNDAVVGTETDTGTETVTQTDVESTGTAGDVGNVGLGGQTGRTDTVPLSEGETEEQTTAQTTEPGAPEETVPEVETVPEIEPITGNPPETTPENVPENATPTETGNPYRFDMGTPTTATDPPSSGGGPLPGIMVPTSGDDEEQDGPEFREFAEGFEVGFLNPLTGEEI